jgi:hypothetical protein
MKLRAEIDGVETTLTYAQLKIATRAYDRGHADGRSAAIEDVLTLLALAGEHAAVRMLKRELGYQAPGHVCTMTDGACAECGARS